MSDKKPQHIIINGQVISTGNDGGGTSGVTSVNALDGVIQIIGEDYVYVRNDEPSKSIIIGISDVPASPLFMWNYSLNFFDDPNEGSFDVSDMTDNDWEIINKCCINVCQRGNNACIGFNFDGEGSVYGSSIGAEFGSSGEWIDFLVKNPDDNSLWLVSFQNLTQGTKKIGLSRKIIEGGGGSSYSAGENIEITPENVINCTYSFNWENIPLGNGLEIDEDGIEIKLANDSIINVGDTPTLLEQIPDITTTKGENTVFDLDETKITGDPNDVIYLEFNFTAAYYSLNKLILGLYFKSTGALINEAQVSEWYTGNGEGFVKKIVLRAGTVDEFSVIKNIADIRFRIENEPLDTSLTTEYSLKNIYINSYPGVNNGLKINTDKIQEKLTAGDNITIENNVISASSTIPGTTITSSDGTITVTKSNNNYDIGVSDSAQDHLLRYDVRVNNSGGTVSELREYIQSLNNLAAKSYVDEQVGLVGSGVKSLTGNSTTSTTIDDDIVISSSNSISAVTKIGLGTDNTLSLDLNVNPSGNNLLSITSSGAYVDIPWAVEYTIQGNNKIRCLKEINGTLGMNGGIGWTTNGTDKSVLLFGICENQDGSINNAEIYVENAISWNDSPTQDRHLANKKYVDKIGADQVHRINDLHGDVEIIGGDGIDVGYDDDDRIKITNTGYIPPFEISHYSGTVLGSLETVWEVNSAYQSILPLACVVERVGQRLTIQFAFNFLEDYAQEGTIYFLAWRGLYAIKVPSYDQPIPVTLYEQSTGAGYHAFLYWDYKSGEETKTWVMRLEDLESIVADPTKRYSFTIELTTWDGII